MSEQQLDIVLPDLHSGGQNQVFMGRKRFTILRTGRQWGKSLLSAVIAINAALDKPNQTILVTAPTFDQTQHVYGAIRRLIRPLIDREEPGIEEPVVVEFKSDHRFMFFNGSRIIARTADNPDRLRGYTLDLVIVDEAALIPKGMVLWAEILRPALAVRGGEALFISTPKGKMNWFFDLWVYAEKDIESKGEYSEWTLFHHKSTDSPFFPESEAEEARKLGDNVYRQEYEAEFTAVKGTIINESDFNYYTLSPQADDVYYLKGGTVHRESQLFRTMTVDLATSKSTRADYTAFAVGDIAPDGTTYVRDVFRDRLTGSKLTKKIIQHARLWKVSIIYVEKAGFQLTVIQQLQERGVTVEPIPAKGDKVARATLLGVRMRSDLLVYLKEASWFTSTLDELTSFDGGTGADHDDRVDALGYLAEVAVMHSGNYGPVGATNITLDDVAKAANAPKPEEDLHDYLEMLRLAKQERINLAESSRARGRMGLEAMRGPR